jgi:hypothetical protein
MGVAVVKEAVLSAINDVTADLADAACKRQAALRPVVREGKWTSAQPQLTPA